MHVERETILSRLALRGMCFSFYDKNIFFPFTTVKPISQFLLFLDLDASDTYIGARNPASNQMSSTNLQSQERLTLN